MEPNQSHKTVVQQLIQSVQKANQAIVESAVAVQERNLQLAQRLSSDWLTTLQDHAHNYQALIQEMEQQGQQQQDAFQQLVEQVVTSYFDSLTAGMAFFVPTLRLTEQLQYCLRALASRYPRHMVTINEAVLGPQTLGAEGWRAADLIELLQRTAPELLQAHARLEMTAQRKGIYLLERSEEVPAFWVYSGGVGKKTPPYRGVMASRQAEQAQRRDEAPGGQVPIGTVQTAVR